MRLTVCLLTRNEEQKLPRAIQSVKPIADQIIVAETGSTDRTAAVAAEHGAEVYPLRWDDDFGAGCNFALAHARGDWILWINPDEEVMPISLFEMDACLARDDVFAYSVSVRDLPHADRLDEYTETTLLRLFRRDPRVRFLGRTSPRFQPPLEDIAKQTERRIEQAPLLVRRHGYLSPLTPDKLRWVARLLELELRDRPGQLSYLIDYGQTLLRLNDARGHDALAAAAEFIIPLRNAPRPPWLDVQRLLDYLMTVAPEQSRSRLTAEDARGLALRWFPKSPVMLWRNAEYYFQINQFKAAALLLERLVEMARTGNYDRSQAFAPSILGEPTRMNLGVCYLRLGQLDQAERCFRALVDSPEFREKTHQNLALLQKLRDNRR